MTSDVLTVWLHGEHLGDLQRLRNGHNRLRFSAEAWTERLAEQIGRRAERFSG